MVSVRRSALLPYPVAPVFDIVSDVTRYPEFLPWCTAVEVIEEGADEVVASLSLAARGVRETFTTRNRLIPCEVIELQLVSGPFREFAGRWTFVGLGGDAGCRVALELDFQLSGLKSLFGSVFVRASDQMVDAFSRRATSLLG